MLNNMLLLWKQIPSRKTQKLGVCADIAGFPSWQLCTEHPSFAPNTKQLTLWLKDVPKTMATRRCLRWLNREQTWIVGHSKAPMYGTKKCDNDCSICCLCLSMHCKQRLLVPPSPFTLASLQHTSYVMHQETSITSQKCGTWESCCCKAESFLLFQQCPLHYC
jgi:hypothetical protein